MFSINRIAAVSPELRSADPFFNCQSMISAYHEAVGQGAGIVIFPAMAVTGKSCAVLLKQPYLLESAAAAAGNFAAVTGTAPAVFGMPKVIDGRMHEVIAVAQSGRIAAYVVKNAADHAPFFAPGKVFDAGVRFSVNFAGDMPVNSPAHIHLFCGAEAEVPGMWRDNRDFYRSLSKQWNCAVAASFAGSGESTGDQLYGGALLICSQGKVVAARPSPARGSGIVYADIDRERIGAAMLDREMPCVEPLKLDTACEVDDLRYFDNPAHPFLPDDPSEFEDFCRETFALQTIGLGERFLRCGAKRLVIGISGGLDSTLALVAMAMVCREYLLPMDTILAVTMPGFGTTGRTKSNAVKLAELLGAEVREILIGKSCLQHFEDIGHDPEKTDSVYENSQARERTQILMDLANAVNGIVVGTGDLSEIALGWSTFNGDQMAMYSINSAIPKSNIACLLEYAAGILPGSAEILRDVIDTPVSPELLPLDANGEIAQKTEVILGAYELHDYYLWHFTHGVSAPEKLLALAKHAFAGKYPDKELLRVRDLFIRRFFTQQFKRTAGPDGIQAGVVSLSARGAWMMPSDINGNLWRR
ncbi:MAG: NAD(+) synthase [Lentisphaeria bacterium]|nr:NAD(+) synthase [Lentisphaeria bacterium]